MTVSFVELTLRWTGCETEHFAPGWALAAFGANDSWFGPACATVPYLACLLNIIRQLPSIDRHRCTDA